MNKPKRDPDATIKRAVAILEDDFDEFVVIARPRREDGPVLVRQNSDPIWTHGALVRTVAELDEQARHFTRVCMSEDE